MSSESESFEQPLRLISMSNGSLVLGKVTVINQHVVQLAFPISLGVVYDRDGEIVATTAAPYQAPFAKMSPFATVNFNINQVVSFAEPSPELVDRYDKVLKKVTESYIAQDVTEHQVTSKDEENAGEDEIDVGMWKPHSTMIH